MQIVNFLEALAGNVRFTIFRPYPYGGHESMHTGVIDLREMGTICSSNPLILSMVDLKERLIQKIKETSNEELLEEVYRLLEIDIEDNEKYILTDEQKAAVTEGREQISRGNYLTNEQANSEIEGWLKNK